MDAALDRRVTPWRDDLAADWLEGRVRADRFTSARPHRVSVALAHLHAAPSFLAEKVSEALFGEAFDVYDEAGAWAWGQLKTDGYVGYCRKDALGDLGAPPTHRIAARSALLYDAPEKKAATHTSLSYGSLLSVEAPFGAFLAVRGPQGRAFVAARSAVPVAERRPDFVAEAEGFLGVPYLWGGRSAHGLDCSALVQLSLAAAGIAAPRDSDLQQRACGRPLPAEDATGPLRRGDLVFWDGHVAIALGGRDILHANAAAMAVGRDNLEEFQTRYSDRAGPVLAVHRLGG